MAMFTLWRYQHPTNSQIASKAINKQRWETASQPASHEGRFRIILDIFFTVWFLVGFFVGFFHSVDEKKARIVLLFFIQVRFLFLIVYTEVGSETFFVFTVLYIVLGLWFLDSMIIPTTICKKNRTQKIWFSSSIFLMRGKQDIYIFVY